MIHVIATINLNDARERDHFLGILKANVPHVLAEDGCVGYAPTVDIPSGIAVQSPLRPDTVTLVEAWESMESLKVHLAAPHMADYRKKVANLVRSVELQVLESA